MPLFVAITSDMEVTFEGEGESESSDGAGGGPRRAFKDAKDVTYPSYDVS